MMATDTEIILNSLQKERDELHARIMQVDRIIKRVKSLDNSPDGNLLFEATKSPTVTPNPQSTPLAVSTYRKTDVKVLIIRAMDIIGRAAQFNEVQAEFNKINGCDYKIKEPIRALKDLGILKIMKPKGALRGFLWIKNEWLVNGILDDKYKPDGFELLYNVKEMIIE